MSKNDILKNVDILSLVDVQIFQTHPGFFDVSFYCHDKTKQLVFDESALQTLNHKLSEKMAGLNARDPNTRGYIEEFVGRMLVEMHRHGLCAIDDVKDAQEDPYAHLRNVR